MTKRFTLDPSEIRALAEGCGSCLASDRITVAGQRVGFMYRELPDSDLDSGWRFFAGEETQDYANDPANFALYDVNTIANYDPEIVAHLDAPAFSAFERDADTNAFVPVPFPGPHQPIPLRHPRAWHEDPRVCLYPFDVAQ